MAQHHASEALAEEGCATLNSIAERRPARSLVDRPIPARQKRRLHRVANDQGHDEPRPAALIQADDRSRTGMPIEGPRIGTAPTAA
jgi:hypothetical protein